MRRLLRPLLCVVMLGTAASAAAQVSGPRVTTIPPGKAWKPNGQISDEVARGLQAREGSSLRHQAEMCVSFPQMDQAECMASVKEKDYAWPRFS